MILQHFYLKGVIFIINFRVRDAYTYLFSHSYYNDSDWHDEKEQSDVADEKFSDGDMDGENSEDDEEKPLKTYSRESG